MTTLDGRAEELVHTTGSQVTDHVRVRPERDLPMSIPGIFTIALAGDIVQTRPIARSSDPSVRAALDPVRTADLALGNLEHTIADRRTFDGHHYGVSSFLVMADPSVAADLAEQGFDVLARANNRLSDFGDRGNRETDEHLRRAGISVAGFGEHLAEARRATYHDLPQGRAGMIAATSSVNHGEAGVFAAAARGGTSNGRPGANHLRVERVITLPPKAWCLLNELLREADYAFPGAFPIQPTVMIYSDRVKVGADWYVPGEQAGYSYRMHPDDLADIVREVRHTAMQANVTILTLHAHQWTIDPERPVGGLAGEMTVPPDFLVELAHTVIDNGADVFCVTGPFEFRAIEIHRGKPILYGLGSFIRQAYRQDYVPTEVYRDFRFGTHVEPAVDPRNTALTDAEVVTARAARHPARYFEGALARCTFSDSVLREIRLYPLDLGHDGPFSELGTPRAAAGDQAERILKTIATRSAAHGTTISIEEGVGVVRL